MQELTPQTPQNHVTELVEAYVAGGLTAVERSAIERHVAECAACADALQAAVRSDADWSAACRHVPPDDGLEDRLVDCFRESVRTSSAWRLRTAVGRLHPLVRRSAIGVAAAITVAAIGYGTNRGLERQKADQAAIALVDEAEAVPEITLTGEANGSVADGSTDAAPRQAPATQPALGEKLHFRRDEFAFRETGQQGGKDREQQAAAYGVADDFQLKRSKPAGESSSVDVSLKSRTLVQRSEVPAMPPAPPAAPSVGYYYLPTGGEKSESEATKQIVESDEQAKPPDLNLGDNSSRLETLSRSAPTPTAAARSAGAASGADRRSPPEPKTPPAVSAVVRQESETVTQRTLDHLTGGIASEDKPIAKGEGPSNAPASPAESAKSPADAAKPPETPAQPAKPAAPAQAAADLGRKIIRNGSLAFEVESFDVAVGQITKISQEEAGFVATTNSEKLPNGKVRGSVTVRCPPEHLDTLVLKLRGIGDLKSQSIVAQDVTKQYTDLDAQLRAAKTMEVRLLAIIKEGGEVKDLLEAEKQLGVEREKIERLEGEMRYLNSQVQLSTLQIELMERDVRTPTAAFETETVAGGIEVEDVEAARRQAIKAFEDAKAQILSSDLKKLDGGQFAASIVAAVAPESAGPVIDRLKQLGRVARLEVSRSVQTEGGAGPIVPGLRVERRQTRFEINLYNLANVAPRQTTSLQLAAGDVEKAYRQVIEQVAAAGGRVVTSQLNRPQGDQVVGTLGVESPTEKADALLNAIRGGGEVMRLDVTTSQDLQNTTDAKRGFSLQIVSLAQIPPRETNVLALYVPDVSTTFARLLEVARSNGARINGSQLNQQNPQQVSGTMALESPRESWGKLEAAFRSTGVLHQQSVARAARADNTVDSKIGINLTILDSQTLQPRESQSLSLVVAGAATRYARLLDQLKSLNARISDSQLSAQNANTVVGVLAFVIDRKDQATVEQSLSDHADLFGRVVSRSDDPINTSEERVGYRVTIQDADRQPPRATFTLEIETGNVDKAVADLEAAALAAGGGKRDARRANDRRGASATVVVEAPLARLPDLVSSVRQAGRVVLSESNRNDGVPEGALSRGLATVTFRTAAAVQADRGLGDSVRDGLSIALTGLFTSLKYLIIGLLVVGPWLIVAWSVLRFSRRKKRSANPTDASRAAGPTSPVGGA